MEIKDCKVGQLVRHISSGRIIKIIDAYAKWNAAQKRDSLLCEDGKSQVWFAPQEFEPLEIPADATITKPFGLQAAYNKTNSHLQVVQEFLRDMRDAATGMIGSLQTEVEYLKRENERLKIRIEHAAPELAAEITKLREALMFYATIDGYPDNGRVARKALGDGK